MAGVITIKFSVMKGGMKQLDMKSPIYIPGPVEPQFGPGRYIYFEGFSVDEHGKQHYLDATVAYRQTCLRVVEYLRRFGEFAILFSAFFLHVSSPPCSAAELPRSSLPILDFLAF
jgi:acetamidase/formamidase